MRTAFIKAEMWTPGLVVGRPEHIIARLRERSPRVDIFHFSQKLPETHPAFSYRPEWDSVAAMPISSYADWWENRLSQVTRKNVRRAFRRGLLVEKADFSDDLIKGIVMINNETPIRQGRRFWHYQESFDEVKKDYSDFLDRSEFIGAYYQNELVGFIRLIYMNDIASVLQLLCTNKHSDKRPANGLLAKAVELCADKGLKYHVYGQYVYGDNTENPLTEFKRRNGFEQFLLPTYYVPLTLKGHIAIKLGVHRGFRNMIPKGVMRLAKKLRNVIYSRAKKDITDQDS
jgi:hypothetical protein